MAKTTSKEQTFEGVVALRSRSLRAYRYKVTLKSSTVKIWLKDRKSKNQWETGELKLSDFIHSDNAIPQASIEDYVSCFINCLETDGADEDEEAECRCDLLSYDSNAWTLEFVLSLTMYNTVWNPKYRFTLKPIPLEAIDVVVTQLRDVQGEVVQLRLTLETKTPVVLGLEAAQAAGPSTSLAWTLKDEFVLSDHFEVDPSGKIRFLRGGTYLVFVSVPYAVIHN